jgi:hypothetical protein
MPNINPDISGAASHLFVIFMIRSPCRNVKSRGKCLKAVSLSPHHTPKLPFITDGLIEALRNTVKIRGRLPYSPDFQCGSADRKLKIM